MEEVVEDQLTTTTIPSTPVLLRTVPVVHWYFQDSTDNNKWKPYDDPVSDQLEAIYIKTGGNGTVQIRTSTFDLKTMKEKDGVLQNIGFGGKRILRGMWFFQDDDDSWVPYETEVAQKLEIAVQHGTFRRVDVSIKPPRFVLQHADGSFKQYRQTKGGNPSGRDTKRGYNGQVRAERVDLLDANNTPISTLQQQLYPIPPTETSIRNSTPYF